MPSRIVVRLSFLLAACLAMEAEGVKPRRPTFGWGPSDDDAGDDGAGDGPDDHGRRGAAECRAKNKAKGTGKKAEEAAVGAKWAKNNAAGTGGTKKG